MIINNYAILLQCFENVLYNDFFFIDGHFVMPLYIMILDEYYMMY